MKKLLTFMLFVAFAALPALAQQNPQGFMTVRYDLDATSIIYCRSNGSGNSPFGAPLSGVGAVTNASSSTTITGSDLTQDVFAAVGRGDVIYIKDGPGNTVYTRGVITKTDADNVVLDEAVDLGGDSFTWTYRDQECGTAATDGWVSAAGLENLSVGLFFKQVSDDGNGIDVRLEGTIKTPDGTTNVMQIWPSRDPAAALTVQNFTVAGAVSNMIVNVTAPIDSLRVGLLFNVADDGTDTLTDAEQITIVLFGQQGGR